MRTKSLLRTLSFAMGLVFSTFVQMQAQNCNGGTVSTTDGADRVYTCPGDGQDDVLSFINTSTADTDYAYAVTDANNVILVVNEGTQNFEGAGVGNCRVWGFSYTGEILAQAGESVFSTQFSDGCWAISSNAIEVIRDVPDGGNVFMPSGRTERVVCTSDSYPDVVIFRHTTSSTATYRYVITDDQNNILGLPPGDNLDFEGVPSGVCRVWGLSYTGDIVASVGQNAATSTLSDGCFELSENFIEVTRTDVDGGTVATADGATAVNTIPGDGIDDVISFTHTTGSSSNYGYVITDNNNKVLGVPGNSQNFEGAGEGVCLVWGISYTGDLSIYPGDDLLDKALSTGCFDLSANVITVTRSEDNACNADGGEITFADGSTSTTIIVDGTPDPLDVTFVTGGTGSNRAWVITDADGNILALPAGPPFDLDGAGAGTCLIWYLRFEDGLEGAAVGNNAADLQGCFDLSNPLTVVRTEDDCQVSGGTITGGPFAFTVGDGEADMISAGSITVANSQGENFQWVVTDDEGYILGLPPMPSAVDFDGAGAGTCLIWYLRYDGAIEGAERGLNANDITGCFSLSNPIEVVRTVEGDCQTNGGELFGGPFAFTVGDGEADMIPAGSITVANSQGENFQWVVTDDEGYILGLPPMPSAVDFDGAGAGTCLIWYLRYDGDIEGAERGLNANDISGCFSLSNPIEVVRTVEGDCQTNGGELFGGPFAFTVGDGEADMIPAGSITVANSQGENFQWVVTDDEGYILGLPPVPSAVNFNDAGPGTCLIWYLRYDGDIEGVGMGLNANDITGCFSLSNPIEVVRTVEGDCQANGGKLFGGPFEFTVGDGVADMIPAGSITVANSQGENFQWVVTDDKGNILGLPPMPSAVNFDEAPAGTCLIWHLSYDGDISGAEMGLNANDITGCWSLSNPIEVIRTAESTSHPVGGTVSTESGETTVYTCTQDGNADVINFIRTGASESNYTFVITNSENVILEIPDSKSADFDGAPAGTCRVWGFAYNGEVTAQPGDDVFTTQFSTGQWAISENAISIVRDQPEGGTVATIFGETQVTTVAGDGFDDIISFLADGTSNSLYTYVITDEENNILGLPGENMQNFEGAGAGVCRVWGLAYTGNILAKVGDNAAEVALTDDCSDLSDNYITVTRVAARNLVSADTRNSELELTNTAVSLYPNPVHTQLTVDTGLDKAMENESQVLIYSVTGSLVREFESTDIKFELNVNDLTPGLYLLQIRNGTQVVTKRFTKK